MKECLDISYETGNRRSQQKQIKKNSDKQSDQAIGDGVFVNHQENILMSSSGKFRFIVRT